jgi:hypothetical protein
MLAFATVVRSVDRYRACALSGIARVAEPDALVVEATPEDGRLLTGRNEALAGLAGHAGLEALVLLDEDVELLDVGFCARIRARLSDPAVAVVGSAQAPAARALGWGAAGLSSTAPAAAVRARHADPMVLALSPWALEHLRFDAERFDGEEGCDADLGLRARQAGREVWLEDVPLLRAAR